MSLSLWPGTTVRHQRTPSAIRVRRRGLGGTPKLVWALASGLRVSVGEFRGQRPDCLGPSPVSCNRR